MKIPFISGRRGDSRREGSRRGTDRDDSDRRQNDRRAEQRRADLRLIYPDGDSPQLIVYPPEAAPKIIEASPIVLTTDFRIAEISKRSMRFICEISCSNCEKPLKLADKLAFTVQFHDDETLDIAASVFRYFGELKTKTGTFVVMLDVPLTQDRIAKEQAYLLKNYPDFCRAELIDKRNVEPAATE